MADEGFKRKLTAILSADVIGYSRLMRDDEEATVRDLASRRVLISDIIQKNHGRVVDSPGDNILAEFASVVDAVNGAIEIQNEIKKAHSDIPEDRRMEFRIGINLGDVIEEEERIYGDGVNIAARVEGLASAGGIAISGTVYEHIKDKLSLGYHYLGEQEVKNIPEPVRVYRLLTEPEDAGKMIGEEKPKSRKKILAVSIAIALIVLVVGAVTIWNNNFRPSIQPALVEKMAFPLPDKPSIAVMAFDNLSGDPEQDLFCDSIAENIITQLSRIHSLFVISHGSSFSYKGKNAKIQQISQELGVRYLLEGSVQLSGERLRITAQLIDAINGRHLWAEKYDREIKDLFAIQDEITNKVVIELAGKLTEGEMSRLEWQLTKNPEAFNYWIQGRGLFRRFQKEENFKARQLFEKAIELDPEFSAAYSLMGWTYAMSAEYGWSKNPAQNLKKIEEFLNKATEVDASNTNFDKYNLWGFLYLIKREYDKAIEQGKLSIEMAPGIADSHAILSNSLLYAGRPEEAIMEMKKAMRLAPFYPSWFLKCIGQAYLLTGQYEEAILAFQKYNERPYSTGGHVWLAIAYSITGKNNLARDEVEMVLRHKPTFSLEEWVTYNRQLYKDAKVVDRFLQFARNAGLPEHQPLKLPDKPSIAVLPFDNLSKDPEQEYFADGMTDDLITDLSKISSLFVIARNSTFQYKGKAVDVKEVSRELGIRYVLEGSVRKAGDQVRINAQLIDATTGGHLWAERYDGQMEDIFSLQDKITQKIVSALAVRLTSSEKENIASKGTDNLEAYDAFMRGWQHYLRHTPESFAQAISDFEKAVEIDPDFSRAYAALALVYLKASGSKEWYEALETDYFTLRVKARYFLNIAMKKPTSLAYGVASSMNLKRRNHDEALQNANKAIALNPADAESQYALAKVLVYSGRPKEAMKIINEVMRLDPNKMAACLRLIGIAHFCLEEYEDAIASFNRSLKYDPLSWVYDWLASSYANIGNDNDARAAFEIEKKRWLEVSAKGETATFTKLDLQPTVYSEPFMDPDVMQRFVDGLIKAGWPEPHRYYEVYRENKLTGNEVRDLVTGRTQVLVGFAGGEWTQKFEKDGKVAYQGFGIKDTGKFWIEGDQCCVTYDKMMASMPLCMDLYRNPGGTIEKKDEYLQVNDFGIMPVSYVD